MYMTGTDIYVIQFPDDKNRDGSQNVGLLAFQLPDMSDNFCHHESFRLHITVKHSS
jgi:hypothetical protein